MKDYIIDALKDARLKELKTAVVTNGTLLNENLIFEILKNEFINIFIFSIDGDKETHNFIRGKGTFEKAYENIFLLSRLKTKLQKRFPKIFIYITVSKFNYKNIFSAVKQLIKLNPNKIRVQLASSVNDDIITQTNKVIGFQAIKTHSYINEVSLKENEIEYIKNELTKINCRIIEKEKIIDKKNEECHFVGKEFVITPDGNIMICPMLNEFYIGNIYNENLCEIFKKNSKNIGMLKKLSSEKKLLICFQCCVEKISK